MKAYDFLCQVKELEQTIRIKQAEIDKWNNIAENSNAQAEGEKVQTSKTQQSMENAVAIYVDIQREVEDCYNKLIEAMRDVTKVIEQLPLAEYDMLHKVYIGRMKETKTGEKYTEYMTLKEVAMSQCKSYSWATNIHSSAKKHVQEILDSRQK